MKILVFDTCFNKSYITLSDNDNIVSEEIIESDNKNYHSAYLIPKIRDILVRNRLFIKDLDAIGVNIGPGSFTGIRAGVTVARVLCQQFNTKLIGINSLEILSCLNENKTYTTVILDARKNKVYFGEFYNYKTITEPILVDKEELINKIKKDTVIIADNSISYFLEENKIRCINYELSDKNLGLYLDLKVRLKLKTEYEDYDLTKVKPLYIQKPSITKPKESKNVF